MKFQNLEDKCLYYRSLTDYRLLPKSYVIVMLDGRSFSKIIKNKYEKPFDDKFIRFMNETARYLCQNVANCKFAYVQSDEISLLLSDFDSTDTDSFFGYRLCKLQSIIASMASAKFNHLITLDLLDTPCSQDDMKQLIQNQKLIEFDCRAWNVPNDNEMFAWFLYRQNDCIKNSKQQTAQAYLSHKELNGLNTDEQIKLLKDEKGIEWESFSDNKKYGRFIYKELVEYHNEELNIDYNRKVWKIHDAFTLNENKDNFLEIVR